MVHLLQVALLREPLDIEMQGIVDLFVEEDGTRLPAARARRCGTKARDKTIRYEIPIIQAAVIEGLESVLSELLLVELLLLLLLQELKFKRGWRELALGRYTALRGNLWRATMTLLRMSAVAQE